MERPRLTRLLDGSGARVRTLVAPAGYGKTTLADQWTRAGGRRAAWYTARSWSSDVAGLALGLAAAAGSLVEGCDVRLRERLRATADPRDEAEVLAEILGEDLTPWPADGWLVIDDYQELATAPEPERFVAALVERSPVSFLIASRHRPSWISGRSILYGDVLELSQNVLAMDDDEVGDVLGDEPAAPPAGLAALAGGWPAVISLASVTPAGLEAKGELPEALYRFFAEEVFNALGPGVQAGLLRLATAPVLDRPLAAALLGDEDVDLVLDAALAVGVIDERGDALELHPLARSFLDELMTARPDALPQQVVVNCLTVYRDRRDWNAAFDVIARQGLSGELEALLEAALDELLETAQLSTIEAWCAFSRGAGLDSPRVAVALAEVALRSGRYVEAGAHAASAAPSQDVAFRALSIAGRAAHLESRETEALALYGRAEEAAATGAEVREALVGQLMCASALESDDAIGLMERLEADSVLLGPSEVVRIADKRLSFSFRFGSVADLDFADRAAELLPLVSDPLVRCSFRSMHANAFALSGRYERAVETATDLIEDALSHRLDLALPNGFAFRAVGRAGRRDWEGAASDIRSGLAAAQAIRDAHGEHNLTAVWIRVLLHQGRSAEAAAVSFSGLASATRGMRGELLACRALALACEGRIEEARELIAESRGLTRAMEGLVLAAGASSIVGVEAKTPDAQLEVERLRDVASRTGALDLVVTAYRASPPLLSMLVLAPTLRPFAEQVIIRAGDADLLELMGGRIAVSGDPRALLTRREREVYELLCQRLTNKQIASALFISEATVKLHAHHVYDKLGVRSRTTLALRATLERGPQATSAMSEGSDSPST